MTNGNVSLVGVKIYNEGVKLETNCEEKIRNIMGNIKTVCETPDINLRVLKSGNIYEGLLWGKANGLPIGIYNRGPSLQLVLETMYRRVKKDCSKLRNRRAISNPPREIAA